MLWRIGLVAARLCVAAFIILTAFYCLLAYIPFTYHQIHLGGLLSWVTFFARYHPYFYAAAFILAVLTLPPLRHENPGLLTITFAVVFGLVGIVLFIHPLLVRLENNVASLYWTFACLIPFPWMALLDWLTQRDKFEWIDSENTEVRRLFWACLRAALFAWLLSSATVIVRFALVSNAGFNRRQWLIALGLSL